MDKEVLLDDRAAAERLLGLLDYVDALIKLDERVAMRLSQHKLQDGSQFVLHEHELTKLPGVSLNKSDDEGPIWLRVQRLQRTVPPAADQKIAAWVEVSQDPEIACSVQSALHKRLTREEKEDFVEQGKLRPEDCSPSLKEEKSKDPGTHFDVFFRLEDQPETQQDCSDYVSNVWATWAERELPRRRSIQAYQRLFEIAQRLSQSGASESVELVWGIGVTRWSKNSAIIDLPILELSVEIEISDDRGADIFVRPRNTPARIDLRAFDKLAENQVALAEQASLRALRIIERDEPEGVSPFRPETFSSILKICGSQLDPEGQYLPETQKVSRSEPLPELAEGHIGVSDRWVLYARRRSINATLLDIQMLKQEVSPEAGEPAKLEGAARTLIMGASDSADSDYEPLGPTLGALDKVSVEIDSQAIDPDHGDLFFPKPFNDDQVQIIRRLEKSEGLVVQGPPGTGKTHTIANIISHMLATGKRVLVVSHGETALKVLRDHLPDGIRDLAISVTASEREGTKQVEKAVQLMLEIVNSVDANLPKQTASIRDLVVGIRADREALELIDRQLADLALVHFEPVPGTSETSYQLATRLAADRSKHSWFTDRPTKAFIQSDHAKETVDLISRTRAEIGPDIIYLGFQLPRLEEFRSPRELVSWHFDLTEAESLVSLQSKYDGVIRRLVSGLGASKSTDLAANFKDLTQSLKLFSAHAWMSELVRRQVSGDARMRRVNTTAFELLRDMRAFLKAYQSFVARPVQMSSDLIDAPQGKQILSSLTQGKNPFGFLSFAAKPLREKFEAVRIAGKAPSTTEDWEYVGQYIRLRNELPTLFVRAISALHRAGIPTFMVKGNHDAESLMSRDLAYPDTVNVFPYDEAATIELDAYRVALHGRSFPSRLIGDFVETYPARRDGWLNIGVLHTSLDGKRGHDGYAPCTVDDLKRFGYDYWALGHVHAAEIVNRDPWIVFPGNLQGRSVRETGAKGAMRVTVEDGRIIGVTPLVLDCARWAHLLVDVANADSEADVIARITAELAAVHAQSDGRPLAARVTLVGTTDLHNHLVARRELLEDDIRANGFQIAADCWVEQLKIKTSLPTRPTALLPTESLDVENILAKAANDPEFVASLAELTEAVKARLPRDLHGDFLDSDMLKALADDARALLAGELS